MLERLGPGSAVVLQATVTQQRHPCIHPYMCTNSTHSLNSKAIFSMSLYNTTLPIFLGSQESSGAGGRKLLDKKLNLKGFSDFFLENPHFCTFSHFFHNLTTKILWEMIGYVSLSFQVSKTCLF